jgi:hypothetical protein
MARPRKLKSGADAHVFTREDCQKGARRTAEIKREAAKSFTERLADELNAQAAELVASWIQQAQGDYRALEAAASRAFGKPQETVTAKVDAEVRVVTAFDADDRPTLQGDGEAE